MNRALFFILILFGGLSVFPQSENVFPARQTKESDNEPPKYCWYNQMILDGLAQSIPLDKNLIVIARLGRRDGKPNLNRRRLHNIRTYLTRGAVDYYNRDEKKIILAEGERVKDFGQIEIYLEGRLIEVLKAFPNADLGVTDCYAGIEGNPICADDYQKSFYPCKDKATIKNIRRKVKRKKSKRS